MIEFDLDEHDYIELHNLLKVTGLCESGGVAKLLIGDGLVRVEGDVELRKRCKIRTGQIVEFNDQQVLVR
jgi:ribosome-associated protein